MPKPPTKQALIDACALVEQYARSIGKDCQIILSGDSMGGTTEVALLSWGGSVVEDSLYVALTNAKDQSGDE